MIQINPKSVILLSIAAVPVLAGPQVGGPSPPAPSRSYSNEVASASSDIVAATLEPYCSTLLGYTTPVATTTTYTTNPPYIYTETDVVYTGTTTITSGYTVWTAAYTTKVFAKRAEATPAPLTKYPPNVISSACSLVATPETSTFTFVSDGGISAVHTSISIDSPVYENVPTATTTVTTITYDCNLTGRENYATAYPCAGCVSGLTSDGSAGLENCTLDKAKEFVNLELFFLDSFAIGQRANGLTYCDFYQYPASQMQSQAPESAPTGWVYWDRQCPGFVE